METKELLLNPAGVDYRKFNKTNLGIEDTPPKPIKLPKDYDTTKGSELIEEAYRYWNALLDFRNRRKRARDYMRGKQWNDVVYVNKVAMTEEAYIMSQGRVPLKNNQIQPVRKSVLGQWRGIETKPIVRARDRKDARSEEMMTNALHKVFDINNITEKDTRQFDEFMLSGLALSRISYEYLKERNHNDIFSKNINPNRVFFNSDIEDHEGKDVTFIGQFVDISADQLKAAFCKEDDDLSWIDDIYSNRNFDTNPGAKGLSSNRIDNLSFLFPMDESKCRVFEIWKMKLEKVLHAHDQLTGKRVSTRRSAKEIDAMNQQRMDEAMAQGVPPEAVPLIVYEKAFEQIWEVYYLTPYGHILYQSETPYTHESHPFVVLAYPLIDGEVWGMYEDIIDQQRYINRMIILFDFIISASAKGVLLVNEDAIPDDSSLDEIAEEWVKYNGVVKLKLRAGMAMNSAAQQVSANATNIGLQEMIALQMRLMQEISGVHGAIQGQAPTAGTSGTLYAQQTQNSVTNLRDLFETFISSYKQQRDWKILKLIGQYYDAGRNIASVNSSDKFENTDYFDPEIIKDLEFDYNIQQSTETPVFRDMMEQNLIKLLEMQAIGVESYLENSAAPFADRLLDSIRKQQQAIASGQQSQGVDQEMMAQAQAQANPESMAMMDKMLGGLKQRAA